MNQFVIPGLTRNPEYWHCREILDSGFRRNDEVIDFFSI